MLISEIIQNQYKPFSYYVLEFRAIPRLSDGLKPVERRSLWAAKKVAHKEFCKVVKLAGATLSNHPHGNVSIENCISAMAQKFAGANNITFFDKKGTFGSRLSGPGKGCSSPRYTNVKLSEDFFKYFDVDSELIEMVPNYDETDKEPSSFLPLVPSVLLNPTSGIAVGFACNILPRKLSEIKQAQIDYLNGKPIKPLTPYYDEFTGTTKQNEKGNWVSYGVYKVDGKKLHITELPIGYDRESYVELLDKLEENGDIKSYTDNCQKSFDFDVILSEKMSDEDIQKKFKLFLNLNENITLIGFNNEVLERVSDTDVIKLFTDWRFQFYKKRYELKLKNTLTELKLKYNILLVIEKELFKQFPNQNKKEIIKTLQDQNIEKENIIKIMQLPIYKFGKEEIDRLKDQVKQLETDKQLFEKLISDESLRKQKYIEELKI
jgi:DNA topoisomerase-2